MHTHKTNDGHICQFRWEEVRGQKNGFQKMKLWLQVSETTTNLLTINVRYFKLVNAKTGMLLIYSLCIQARPQLESTKSKKMDIWYLRATRILWHLLLMPWRLLFVLVPPYQIARGWIAFIGSLIFISGIAYVVTKLTDGISCVTGINPYVIASTALAGGTSWPDLVASKIAAERQVTADSAIANIICSSCTSAPGLWCGTWRAKAMGLVDGCVVHVSLAYFCCFVIT